MNYFGQSQQFSKNKSTFLLPSEEGNEEEETVDPSVFIESEEIKNLKHKLELQAN